MEGHKHSHYSILPLVLLYHTTWSLYGLIVLSLPPSLIPFEVHGPLSLGIVFYLHLNFISVYFNGSNNFLSKQRSLNLILFLADFRYSRRSRINSNATHPGSSLTSPLIFLSVFHIVTVTLQKQAYWKHQFSFLSMSYQCD